MPAGATAAVLRRGRASRAMLLALVSLCALLASIGAPALTVAAPPQAEPDTGSAAEQRRENVIVAALAYLGVPYRLGSEGPDLMDCSGLVFRAFADAGEVRRVGGARLGARSYMRWFANRGQMTQSEEDAERGDLVVYAFGEHIGFYLGDGRVLSALLSGVTVHPLRGITLEVTGFLRVDWTGKGDAPPLVTDPLLPDELSETPAALISPAGWVPALDLLAADAQPARGTERVDMRTATTRTFENPDGTFSTEFHVQPIHFQAADSTDWQPIDLAFAAIDVDGDGPDDGAQVSASPAVLSLYPADQEGGLLSLAAGGRSLAVDLVAESTAWPQVSADGRFADYFDILPTGVGLRVFARVDGFKSFLVLPRKPDTNRFSFSLQSVGTTLTAELDGSVTLRDEAGAVVGRLPHPLLLDSSDVEGNGGGVYSSATALTVEEGGQIVTLSVDRRYLAEAVYPVFVDLSLVDFPAVAPGGTLSFVSSRHPNANFDSYQRPESPAYGELWLGRQPNTRHDNEIYLRFDDPRQALGTVDVRSAALELYPYWQVAGAQPTAVHRVSGAWDAYALTWNVRPPTDVQLATVDGKASEWTEVDLSESVLAQMSGTATDYGLMLAASQPGAGSWKRFIGQDVGGTVTFGPRLVITWSGLRPTGSADPGAATTAPVVGWTQPPIAVEQDRFEVQVSTDNFATLAAGSDVIKGADGSTATWAVPTDGLVPGTTYAWRVRTKYADYSWGAWSTAQTFTFGQPAPEPAPWPVLDALDADD